MYTILKSINAIYDFIIDIIIKLSFDSIEEGRLEYERKLAVTRFAKWNKKLLKLTPSYVDGLEIYTTALNSAMEDDDIKSIGITGSYGSGKSTVIETYKTIYKKKKFIHIAVLVKQNGTTSV